MIRKLAVITIGIFLAVSSAEGQKRKVAVLDFGYATVRSSVQAYMGTDQDIGKGISELLIKQLLEGGDYRIIERSVLDTIIKEQNFQNTDRADPATAAKIGGLLGVDAVIVGDITSFGNDDKHYGGGGGGEKPGRAVVLAGLGWDKKKTIVEISARIVDVNSAEVLASVDGKGETNKGGVVIGGGGANRGGGGAGAFTMTSSNFANSEIGKAVKLAVVKLAANLDSKAGALPPPSAPRVAPLPPLSGLVADFSAGEVTINAGKKSGVKVGDTLSISHVDRWINDPNTGKPIHAVESTVGTLRVTEADADSAVGKFSGAGVPAVGDRVKRPDGQ